MSVDGAELEKGIERLERIYVMRKAWIRTIRGLPAQTVDLCFAQPIRRLAAQSEDLSIECAKCGCWTIHALQSVERMIH